MQILLQTRLAVKEFYPRLVIGFNGELIVVEKGIPRKPRGLDLATAPRPVRRIVGYRDGEVNR